MNYFERKRELENLEKEMAKESNREARTISFEKLPEGVRGYYDPEYPDVIVTNKNMVKHDANIYQSMRTVIHEGRHAYQDDVLKGRIEPKETDKEKIESWKHNSREMGGHYIKYQDSPEKYRFQPKEEDANNFASETMNSFNERFKNAPEYHKHINDYDKQKQLDCRRAQFQLGENYRDKIAEELKEMYQQKSPAQATNQQQNASNKPTTAQEQKPLSPAVQKHIEKQAERDEKVKAFREAQGQNQDLTQGRGK